MSGEVTYLGWLFDEALALADKLKGELLDERAHRALLESEVAHLRRALEVSSGDLELLSPMLPVIERMFSEVHAAGGPDTSDEDAERIGRMVEEGISPILHAIAEAKGWHIPPSERN